MTHSYARHLWFDAVFPQSENPNISEVTVTSKDSQPVLHYFVDKRATKKLILQMGTSKFQRENCPWNPTVVENPFITLYSLHPKNFKSNMFVIYRWNYDYSLEDRMTFLYSLVHFIHSELGMHLLNKTFGELKWSYSAILNFWSHFKKNSWEIFEIQQGIFKFTLNLKFNRVRSFLNVL